MPQSNEIERENHSIEQAIGDDAAEIWKRIEGMCVMEHIHGRPYNGPHLQSVPSGMDDIMAKTNRDKELLLLIERQGLWECPLCNHLMPWPPTGYHICPHCMKEFGSDADSVLDAQPLWKRA